MIARLWLCAALMLSPGFAHAQGAIQQLGPWTKGQIPMISGNARLMSGGGSPGPGLQPANNTNPGTLPTGLGVVNSGLGFCDYTGYSNAAYNQMCWGFDGSGNGLIKLGRVGGGGALSLFFDVNGSISEYPGAGNGNILGPISSTINELVVWNNGTGTLVKDGAGVSVVHTGALSVVAGTTNGLRITGPGPVPVLTPPQAAGGNTLFIGNTGETPTSNWLETLVNYTVSDAKLAALSNTGGYGVLGASRVSDNPLTVAPAYSFGVGGIVRADAAYAGQTGIGGFFQAYNTGIGTSQGVEIDSVNRSGPNPGFSPYTWLASLPATMGLWVASGQGDTLALPSSLGFGIINNLGTFKTGIMVDRHAIEGGTGSDSDAVPLDAIALARLHAIDFWNSGDTVASGPSSRIYSSAQSTHTRTTDLVFSNDGLYVLDHALSLPVAAFKTGATSNCAMVVDNQTAAKLGIGFTGTATSCDALYVTKNVGTHSFFVGATAIAQIALSGMTAQNLIVTQASPLAADACIAGQITTAPGFLYACASSGNWQRVALTGGY